MERRDQRARDQRSRVWRKRNARRQEYEKQRNLRVRCGTRVKRLPNMETALKQMSLADRLVFGALANVKRLFVAEKKNFQQQQAR